MIEAPARRHKGEMPNIAQIESRWMPRFPTHYVIPAKAGTQSRFNNGPRLSWGEVS